MSKNKSKKRASSYEVQFIVTAHNDAVDGYMEILQGMFVATGLMLENRGACKSPLDSDHTHVSFRLILKAPPLGSLGLDDIPDCVDK